MVALRHIAPLAALLLAGCARDWVARTGAARAAYERYDTDRALELLADAEKEGPRRDELVALLERGMVLHAAGRYEESIAVLARAEQLAASLEVVSVSEEALTLFADERQRAYRGEDFEKLMVNVIQALSYAALRRSEDALVEVRRIDARLRRMIQEEKKPYQRLAIARYLGGVLYEDQGELDSAFIDYEDALRLEPRLTQLAGPLLRLARATGREEAHAQLAARFPGVDDRPLGRDEGQVVVVVEQGLSPQKSSSRRGVGPDLLVVPVFRERPWDRAAVRVVEDGAGASAATVTSIESVAQVHLNDRIGRVFARAAASTATKAGVAAAVGAATDSAELGWLTFWTLTAGNDADLRSWLALPAEIRVARLRLPAGEHRLRVVSPARMTEHVVTVEPRRTAIVVERRY